MEKQDVPNARDEIRKLQDALKAEDSGFPNGIRAKKTRVGRKELQNANGIKPNGKVDPAKTKEMKE